jgi:hypothetical protein
MTEKQLIRLHQLTNTILQGLDGSPFHWGQGERWAYTPMLKKIGITLVTRTQIDKRGYRLKRSQNPVGTTYFGTPIDKEADVFVLEIQCVIIPEYPNSPAHTK